MDRKEDIDFLERFRLLVEEYLTVPNGNRSTGRKARNLKKQLGEMKPRAEKLFAEYGLERRGIAEPPQLILGGIAQWIDYSLLSLITNDTLRSHYHDPATASDEKILDLTLITIDECIGHLKMSRPEGKPVSVNKARKVRSIGTGEGHVFIAMPMATEDLQLEDIHEAIKNAARDAGLVAERVDEQNSNEKITDRIVEAITEAEFVVADLSQAKPNVYWEAGYAHGLEKTPIYIARMGTRLEFDVKDYPVIFYENATRLRRELARRLQGLKSAT